MAITSVDSDADALSAAKKAIGVRTNREAIDLALRGAVSRHCQLRAVAALSKIPVDADAQVVPRGS